MSDVNSTAFSHEPLIITSDWARTLVQPMNLRLGPCRKNTGAKSSKCAGPGRTCFEKQMQNLPQLTKYGGGLPLQIAQEATRIQLIAASAVSNNIGALNVRLAIGGWLSQPEQTVSSTVMV
jgi:hypothetical protein